MIRIIHIFFAVLLLSNASYARRIYDTSTVFIIAGKPDPQISGQNTISEFSESTYETDIPNGTTVEWNCVGGTILGDVSESEVRIKWGSAGDGEVSVTHTNEYGCSDSTSLEVTIESLSPDSDILLQCPAFGEFPVDPDLKKRASATLTNLSGDVVEIESVTSSSSEFVVVDYPSNLGPNASGAVLIDFQPAQLGARTGELSAYAAGSAARCDLSGTGIALPEDAEKVGMELSIEPNFAAPGDTVQLKLKLVGSDNLPDSALEYATAINLNPLVLLTPKNFSYYSPLAGNDVRQIKDGDQYPLKIDGTRILGEDLLITVNLEVLLGDEDTTAVVFKDSPSWSGANVPVYTILKDSVFVVDICRAGGERLLKFRDDESFIDKIKPNPAPGGFKVEFYLAEPGEVQIELVDFLGKKSYIEDCAFPKGRSEFVIDASDLPAGVYTLSIRSGSSVLDFEKVMIMK